MDKSDKGNGSSEQGQSTVYARPENIRLIPIIVYNKHIHVLHQAFGKPFREGHQGLESWFSG